MMPAARLDFEVVPARLTPFRFSPEFLRLSFQLSSAAQAKL